MSSLPTGTVTFLFTDIEASTQLLHRLGHAYANVLEQHRVLLRAVFQKHAGHEISTQGDSFFVAFARARDAVAASVESQIALAAHQWPDGASLKVRIGIHSGEPTNVEDNYVGVDVHHGARLMSAGHGGQVLLSHTAHNLVAANLPDGTSLRDLGAHRLKDIPHADHIFQVVISGLPADFPPIRTLSNRLHNLPAQLTTLIGRGAEVAAVNELLQRPEVRLVTLTGTGGTGKTRLGLQVASELLDNFEDGIFFVPLASVSDPALVAAAIESVMGFHDVAGQPLLSAVKEYLRDRQVLLLLDNFEQVVSAAPLISDLLTSCPKLKMLITSRVALRIGGEREYAVPPLALPGRRPPPPLDAMSQFASVALFIERAQAVKSDFSITNENAPAIAEICFRLDGLPLAIELAAARVKLLSPSAMLSRLESRLKFLTGGARDQPERQQTLRAAIAWSHDLLDSEQQAILRRLAIFVGGCTLEAVEAVCSGREMEDGESAAWSTPGQLAAETSFADSPALDVFEGVSSLMDNSLLWQQETEGEPRFFMLETIREFASERLQESGEAAVAARRHATYFLQMAAREVHHTMSVQAEERIKCLDRMKPDHDNLRAAILWSLQGDPNMALQLVDVTSSFFWGDRYNVAEQSAEEALEKAVNAPPGLVGSVLAIASTGAARRGDYRRQGELAMRRLELARAFGNDMEVGWALFHLASAFYVPGDYEAAIKHFEESLQIFRTRENESASLRQNVGWTLNSLGGCAGRAGDLAGAWKYFEESADVFRRNNDRDGLAGALSEMSAVALQEGDVENARRLSLESERIENELGDTRPHPWRRHQRGYLAWAENDLDAARSQFERMLRGFAAVGEVAGILIAFVSLGCLAQEQGRFLEAAILLCVESAQRETLGLPVYRNLNERRESALLAAQSALGEAKFEETCLHARTLSLPAAVARALPEGNPMMETNLT